MPFVKTIVMFLKEFVLILKIYRQLTITGFALLCNIYMKVKGK